MADQNVTLKFEGQATLGGLTIPVPPAVVTLVVHGSDADTSRPVDAKLVIWRGNVEPNKKLPGDLWQRLEPFGMFAWSGTAWVDLAAIPAPVEPLPEPEPEPEPVMPWAVKNLVVTAGNGFLRLDWAEEGNPDSVIISKDGEPYKYLPGGTKTFTTPELPDGYYRWTVIPVKQGNSGQGVDVWHGCMKGTVWVDPVKGSDSNAGTVDKPLKTILAAGKRITQPGQRIVLRGGLYREYLTKDNGGSVYGGQPVTTLKAHGTPDKPCELRSFPGEKVIIDGSHVKRPLGPQATDPNRPELLSVMGNHWLVSGWPGPLEDPLAYAIELRNSAGCLFRSRLTKGVRVQWVDAHHAEGSAFNMQECEDWEVSYCAGWAVYSTVNDGETADGVQGSRCDRAHVHHNFFAWCGDDGIDFVIGKRALVEHNVVYRAGYLADGRPGRGNGNGIKAGGLWGTNIHDNVVRRNIIIGSRESGITANNGFGILIEHNTTIGNKRGYAGRCGGDTVRFVGNLSHRDQRAALIDNASGAKPTEQGNSWNLPVTVTDADFESVTFDEAWRSWAQLVAAGFAKLRPDSDLKGRGVDGRDLGWEG